MSTHNLLIASVGVYVLVAIATAYYALKNRGASVFEPIIQIIFFVSLFTIPLPLRAWLTTDIEGDVSPYLAIFEPYLPTAVFMTAMALPVICLFYYSKASAKLAKLLPTFTNFNVYGFRLATYSLIALSFGLLAELVREQGSLVQFLLLGYKSTEQTFGQGYLAVGFPWLIVAMMAQLESWVQTRFKPDLVGFITLLIINMGMQILTGNRAIIVYMTVVLIVFWNFRIRKIKLKIFFPIAVAMFMALNMLGLTRGSHFSDFGDYVDTTSEVAGRAAGQFGSEGFFYTLTTGEFVVPFETFPQMIRSIGVTDPPWYGASILRVPLFIVPSVLYPERPLPLASWYMENYYGGGYLLNEGRAFFFLAEGYLNFGFFGVMVIAALWGLLWGMLNAWMKQSGNRPVVALAFALLVGFIFRCVGGDSTTLFIATLQQSIAAVILIVWMSKLFGPGPTAQAPAN